MKIGQWVVVIGTAFYGACSSGNGTPADPECPGSSPTLCTHGSKAWCCGLTQDCSETEGLCIQQCPSSTPVSCGHTSTQILCCPSGTHCGDGDTCVPLGTGGATQTEGGASNAGGGGAMSIAGAPAGGGGASGASCTTSDECPKAAPCCAVQDDGSSHCAVFTDKQCRCAKGTDCSSGACAPAVNVVGTPSGPYVCVPNDGKAYHGCSGALLACDGGYCCLTDSNENQFCAKPCELDAECSNGSTCHSYSGAHTSCLSSLGCGPK